MNLKTLTQEDEDQVSKVDLAHEIERTREILHSCDGEISEQITQLKGFIEFKTTEMLARNKQAETDLRIFLKEEVASAKKEVAKGSSSLFEEFHVLLNTFTSGIDKKFEEFRIDVQRQINSEVSNYLDGIYKANKETEEKVEKFRDDLMAALSVFQVETRGRVTGLSSDFEAIRAKFANIAKTLS